MGTLSSQLWTHHLKPQGNELLSSWMIRLAHAHGYKVERMSRILFGRGHALWGKDIDKICPPAVLATMCAATGVSIEQARRTSLQSYQGILSEAVLSGGYSSWVVPLHIHHRKRTAPGLMYCPQCLQRDDVAFFRRHWRLAFVTVCTEHGIELRDSCSQCASPVIPHRVDIGKLGASPRDRAFTRCWQCHAYLSAGETTSCDTKLLAFTRHLETVLDQGFVDTPSLEGIHPILYFAGLRILAHLSQRHQHDKDSQALPIERVALGQRRVLMRQTSALLSSWPVAFLDFVQATGIRYSDIVQPRHTLPFWLERVVSPLKRHQHPERSHAELAEVERVIRNREGVFRASMARHRYGVHADSARFPSGSRTTVHHDVHVTLIASLEHAVASTFDHQKRFAWLQDQVMFNLLRFTTLSCAEICALRLRAVESRCSDTAKKDDTWWDIPSNEAQAWDALQRFIAGPRMQASWTSSSPQVFISPFTQKPLQASALQARFGKAVVHAMLTAPIHNLWAYKAVSAEDAGQGQQTTRCGTSA